VTSGRDGNARVCGMREGVGRGVGRGSKAKKCQR
jgi:hypothetical protein